MRALVAAVIFALSPCALSCGGSEPLGTQCKVSTQCGIGLICVDGSCVAPPGGLPIGEGEGEGASAGTGEGEGIPKGGGEGEGDIAQFGEGEGEGNGQSGEGEGAAGEGEGAAGEGEGTAGEGEGEGEGAPPSCPPDQCGSFMTCVADNSCDPGANTPCNAFDFNPTTNGTTAPAIIDFFADQTSTSSPPDIIDEADATRFDFTVTIGQTTESFDSFWLTRQTALIRPKMFVHYEVSSTLDTVLIALDSSGGSCNIVPGAFSDTFAAGGNESFDINYATAPTSLLIGVGTCDGLDGQNCVAGSPNNAALTTGNIELRANGILCPSATLTNPGNAADDVTADQTTYDECFRALYEVSGTSNTCANSNPCARNTSFGSTGKFCCLQSNCGHTPGQAIKLVTDSPTGPCHF